MLSEMSQSTHPEIFGLSSSRTDEWAGMLNTWIFFFFFKEKGIFAAIDWFAGLSPPT